MAIDPRQGYGANPTGKPPMQRLSGAKLGFPTPGLPANRTDQIPNTPPAMTTRQHAYDEAARLLQDNKVAILLAEAVAMGVRRGWEVCNKNTQDPNLYWSNAGAEPINILGKFVITPVNPTPAQLAAADLLAAANFNPATGVLPASPSEYPTYQYGIINGIGLGLTVPIRSGEVLIFDTFGLTTFSEVAEYEVLWALSYGAVQPGSTAPTNQGTTLIPQRRGWLGTAERPVQLHGFGRIAPQQGPLRTGESTVVVSFRHDGDQSNPAAYTPWPHLVEVALRGWKVVIGPEGEVQTRSVGGPSCSPEAGR